MSWENAAPRIYQVVTGFFPEKSPKQNWATNPRPLLVCGVARDPESRIYFCRVAYGTSKHVNKAHQNDLVIANISVLDSLGLKYPTRFLNHAGKDMVIMPWTKEFFQPWVQYRTPVLGMLPEDAQHFVGSVLGRLTDLPQF